VKGIILIEPYWKSPKRETGGGKKYERVTYNRLGNYMEKWIQWSTKMSVTFEQNSRANCEMQRKAPED
jgi:hypothetical protein